MADADSDPFFDIAGWQAMFEGEADSPPDGCIGIIRRADFTAHHGSLLVWRGGRTVIVDYAGSSDVAVLLVADEESMLQLRARGFAALPPLIRQGRLHPYILKTLDQLEDAGMMDFIEDLGLVFPKH